MRSYKATQCKYIKYTNTKKRTRKYNGIRSDEGYYNHAIQYYTPPKNINRFIQTRRGKGLELSVCKIVQEGMYNELYNKADIIVQLGGRSLYKKRRVPAQGVFHHSPGAPLPCTHSTGQQSLHLFASPSSSSSSLGLAGLWPARPSGRLTSRLRRSAWKWEVIIFCDRQTHKHCIIKYISTEPSLAS